MLPPIPVSEAARLDALASTRLLDSPKDPFFDGLAEVLSRLLGAPIAAVTLIDAKRQWFKAITGMEVQETSRDVAFCAHTICEGGAFVVPDAQTDSRFAANPLVTGAPFIRSYAGVPLCDAQGHVLGAMCAIDTAPRLWRDTELALIASFSTMATQHIEALTSAHRAKELETLHQTVVTTMAEGVVVQTQTGEIRLANSAALSILGLTIDQITGRSSMDVDWQSLRDDGSPFPGEDHPAMVVLRTGQPVNDVVMGVSRPDGSRKWIKINSRPVFRDSRAAPVEAITTFSDITAERTAQNQLRSQQQKLDMALDLGSIAVSVYDASQGDIRRFGNAETLRIFAPASDKSADPFIERAPKDRQHDLRDRWQKHLAGGSRLKVETPVILADGTERWALVGAEKLQDEAGRVTGAIVALKDIDQRKRAEFALIESMQKLETASRAKDVFLANIGHEIRTPLNGVIGLASALALTNLSPDQLNMVNLITSSGEVLDRLLNDLLDMSKLDAGKVELDVAPFDLGTAVAEASQLFALRAEEKALKFSLDVAPEVRGLWAGDKVRIKQIVANLVSNAVKYTERGQVQVRLSATGSPNTRALDWVTLEVEDTGSGLSPHDQLRIFDRFEQANGATGRVHGGTGLGLSICKSLASLMGGDIKVESMPGFGSTFTAQLPIQRAGDGAATASSEHDEAEAKRKLMRVLLVDDHATNQRVVEAMLRAFDCEIAMASNGAEGLAAFQAGEFDLVLMDMAMPVMDGVAATRAIRTFERQSGAKRTPVAMLTAHGSDQHKLEAQDAGADFHIVKPVTPVTLLAGLEKAIRASKAQSDAA
jgi:PAS domain S-box-containing protein